MSRYLCYTIWPPWRVGFPNWKVLVWYWYHASHKMGYLCQGPVKTTTYHLGFGSLVSTGCGRSNMWYRKPLFLTWMNVDQTEHYHLPTWGGGVLSNQTACASLFIILCIEWPVKCLLFHLLFTLFIINITFIRGQDLDTQTKKVCWWSSLNEEQINICKLLIFQSMSQFLKNLEELFLTKIQHASCMLYDVYMLSMM